MYYIQQLQLIDCPLNLLVVYFCFQFSFPYFSIQLNLHIYLLFHRFLAYIYNCADTLQSLHLHLFLNNILQAHLFYRLSYILLLLLENLCLLIFPQIFYPSLHFYFFFPLTSLLNLHLLI